jgi:hypothetical protein
MEAGFQMAGTLYKNPVRACWRKAYGETLYAVGHQHVVVARGFNMVGIGFLSDSRFRGPTARVKSISALLECNKDFRKKPFKPSGPSS